MKLSDISNDGIVQTMDRLAGTATATYSFKAKMADINDALDRYFAIAFEAEGHWSFDDINQTSPPIDTQNIVSGTNRYKVGTFTEKIINLIKIEVLDANADGMTLTPEDINHLSSTFEELYLDTTTTTGNPTHYCKYGDFIYLRPTPNYSETAGLKVYFNRPASRLQFVSCQPEADDELITAVAHGLAANDTVIFEADAGGTMSTGLTADTQYFVIASGLTADVFKVSATKGGSSVNITADGTGVTFLKTSTTPGIQLMHHIYLARRAALTYLSYINSPKLGFLPNQILLDEKEIKEYFSTRSKETRKIINTRKKLFR